MTSVPGIGIGVGARLPDGVLSEWPEHAAAPADVQVGASARGKRIVMFGLPGAFTPTCSNKHLPAFIALADALRSKGVDEIWCVAVNDVHVMAAWGRDQHAAGKVRMLADGNGALTTALGLQVDLRTSGMGTRSRRYAMLLDDGIVTRIGVEASGQFAVSTAEAMLAHLD